MGNQPTRPTKFFGKKYSVETREEKKQKLPELREHVKKGFTNQNIALFGTMGVGKSSLINTIATALTNSNAVQNVAEVGANKIDNKTIIYKNIGKSIEDFGTVETINGKEWRLNLWDTRGLTDDPRAYSGLIEGILEGRLKDEQLMQKENLNNKFLNYFADSSKVREIHCVIFVIQCGKNEWTRLGESVKAECDKKGIPICVVVTHYDILEKSNSSKTSLTEAKNKTTEDIAKVFNIGFESIRYISNFCESDPNYDPIKCYDVLEFLALPLGPVKQSWDRMKARNS